MIIFNRVRPEKAFADHLHNIADQNAHVKGLYLESVAGKKRHYDIKYLNEWKQRLRFIQNASSKF